MQNEDFEKGLRDRLHDYEMPVDTEQLWRNVAAAVQPEKKRRGLIWWWLPGLLLLGSVAWFAWQALEDDQARTQDAGLVVEQGLVVSAGGAGAGLGGDLAADGLGKAALRGNSDLSVNHFPGGETMTAPADNSDLSVNHFSGGETMTVPADNSDLSINHFSGRETTTPPADNSDLSVNHFSGGETTALPADNSDLSINHFSGQEAAQALRPATGRNLPSPAPGSNSPAPAAAPEELTGDAQQVIPTQQLTAARSIATLPVALLPTSFYDPTTPLFSELKDPACPVFTRKSKPAFTLEAAGIFGRPVRTIAAPNADQTGQRDRNLALERPLEALTGQLLLGYETGSGFSLRSGLGFTRINSVAELTVDTTVSEITTGISEVIVNGPGDTTFITGLIERRITTTGTARYYNRLNTIDLPILLGKTFRAGKWRFGVEAGPVLNLRSSGSARYPMANGSFSTRADNAGLFRSRLPGVGWQGSLFTSFRLLPKLDVNLGFQASGQPRGGFEVAGAATRTNYTIYGIRLGVKRRF